MNITTAEQDAARKSFGLLTIREWLAKWLPNRNLPALVGDFTLDGGRGFVPDEPPRMCLRDDGSFFVNCGGHVVIALPPVTCVSERFGHATEKWYAWKRNGAFYFTLSDDNRGLKFAEAG